MPTIDSNYIDPASVSVWPNALRYGGIAAAITIAFGLIMHLTGMTDYEAEARGEGNGWISNLLTCVVGVAAIVMAIKHHRDNELGGYISYGRAFWQALSGTLIFSVIIAIWSFVFFSFIAPEVLDLMIEITMDELPEDQIEVSGPYIEMVMSPVGMAIIGSLFFAFMGGIFSLIISAIMKKESPL